MGTGTETVVSVKEGRTRRFRSKQERRQIVEETLKPGASVSLVARANDVNTNQLFTWRRQYRAGKLELESPLGSLLPIKVTDSVPKVRTARRHQSKAKRSGIIDIDLGHARVCIEGEADPECVKAVLERLIR